jgi:ABC-type sulfate transport system permease subunit
MALERFCLTVLLAIPLAVLLSVTMALAVADGRFKNGLMLWQFYGKERQIRMH